MAKTTIKSTTNYNMFTEIKGNRPKNQAHINKLKSSFSEDTEAIKYTPILVNERHEIIDGQHRFEAIKDLNLPVFYIEHEGLTLETAQKINSSMKNWTPKDWAESYASLDNPNYVKFLELMDNYKLPFNVLMKYAAGYGNYPNSNMFKRGTFKIGDIKTATKNLDFLVESGQYYQDYRRKGYGEALLIMLNHPRFDKKRFLASLTGNKAKKLLRPYDSMPEYLRVLTQLYNSGLAEKNRIMFYEQAI